MKTTTDLLDRYLQAVRFWLPRRTQQDIIAELSEEIQSQIEEKASALGRDVNEDELEAILKRLGAPLVVAHRYLPQRHLIGPVLYPIYIWLLKWFALLWVIPWLLVWLGFVIFSPEYRAHNPVQKLGPLGMTCLCMAINTTLAFAIIERFCHPACKDWNPRRLLLTDRLISRTNSIFALSLYCAALAWWVAHAPVSRIMTTSDGQLTLAPVWPFLYWCILVLTAVRIMHWGVNLFRPYWTKPRLVFRLILDLLASAAFCALFKAQIVVAVTTPELSPAQAAEKLEKLNELLSRSFWVVLAFCILAVSFDVSRLIRLARPRNVAAPALALLLVLTALLPRPADAQTNAASSSLSLPSDAEIRQILLDRIDVQQKSVGMVAGIITAQGRRIISYGRIDPDDARRLDGDTVFEIGSVTKVFTALLLADMAQRGEMSLTDPVAKHLPASVQVPERNGRKITLVDLATHTSGLPFFPADIPLEPKDESVRIASSYPLEKLYRFVSNYQLTREAGSQWEYSNLGMSLLGLALENRAGTNYDALIRARITGPLRMRRTGIAVNPEMKARLNVGHDVSLQPVPGVTIPAFYAAGALRSTANDLLTFLGAFIGQVESPLAPAMAAMLRTTRPAPGMTQTLGWWIVPIGTGDEGIVTHGGETPGFACTVAFDRQARVGVVVLSNTPENDGGLAWHLLRPAYPVALSGAVKARKPIALDSTRKEIALDPTRLGNYTGHYQPPRPAKVLTVERAGDTLVYKSEVVPQGLRIYPASEREFFVAETPLLRFTFQTDARGYATNLIVRWAGTDTAAGRVP